MQFVLALWEPPGEPLEATWSLSESLAGLSPLKHSKPLSPLWDLEDWSESSLLPGPKLCFWFLASSSSFLFIEVLAVGCCQTWFLHLDQI